MLQLLITDKTALAHQQNATNISESFWNSNRWTLNLPPGKWSICSRRPKKSTEISRVENVSLWFSLISSEQTFIIHSNVSISETKSQFARDDPAFLVLFACWLCVSSIGFAIVLGLGFFSFIKFLLYVVFIDCIGMGILVASVFWYAFEIPA